MATKRASTLLSVIIVLLSLLLLTESRHGLRRRSHHRQMVCRKEFIRPLERRVSDVELIFSGTVEKIFEGSASVNGSGLERRRRQHVMGHQRHRHHHHLLQHRFLRQSADSDVLSPAATSHRISSQGLGFTGNSVNILYHGRVRVTRVYKGEKRLEGKLIIVEGFGSDRLCVSEGKEREKLIFFTNPIAFPRGRVRMHLSLMHLNPENLHKVHSAIKAAAASERLQALDQIHLLKEQSEGTTSTTTTTTTTRSTTTTTSAPTIPPASFELPYHALAQSSFESARKQVIEEPASVSLNEIDSSDPPKVKPTKQKKKKSKTKKSRRKHHHRRQSSTSTTTSTTEFPINSSTFSLLEESMLT